MNPLKNRTNIDAISASDYSPFGVELANRTWSVEEYRSGFNGKELDKEGMGGGSFTYDYGFRIYNPALGKFLSVDPLTLSYPWYTTYQFAGNKPIESIDLDCMEELSTKEVTSRLWYGEPEIKKQSEWHWDNIVDNPDGLYSQFARASKCNKMHSGAALYKNVAEKHAYYIWCQAYIDNKKNGGGSQWFGAAAHVTGVLGVGGAEYPDGGFFTSDAIDKFLIGGNEYLFGENMNNMKGLMNGSLALDFIAADGKKSYYKR